MTTPARRPSPAVYRRRRIVAVVLVLVVILAVVLAIWQPWRGAGTPQPSTSSTPEAVASSTPPTVPSGDAAAETPAEEQPPAEPEADPSATEAGVAPCTTGNISVQAITDKDEYAAGENPQLSITLSNTSQKPCLINVGTATQVFVVTSGSDTWWRSTDCQSESSDQAVQLEAGQTVSSVTPLVWDRTRSSVDSCASTRPQAAAGYYHLQVSIGGIQAADTKMFQLR